MEYETELNKDIAFLGEVSPLTEGVNTQMLPCVDASYESMQFKVGQAGLLKHFVFSQAGTLTKALSELVMNSIDGKASKIHISIVNEYKIIIEDDGVGFKSREEVETLFAELGFDHDTQIERGRNRIFGRFGLGRAQIFAFGRSRWLSNHLEMVVDFKGKLDSNLFHFKEHKDVLHTGCKIEIDLYQRMDIGEFTNLKRSLTDMIRYVPCQVTVGGQQVNIPFDTVKWTHETENLRFRLSTSTRLGLDVYNGGVFVKNYPFSCFGISGELTSTNVNNTGFVLNIARNDITEMQCSLFKEMKTLLAPLSVKLRRRVKLGTSETWRMFMQGLISPSDLEKAKIFNTAKGHPQSFNDLKSKNGERFGIIDHRMTSQEAETLAERYGISMVAPSSFYGLDVKANNDGEMVDTSTLYLHHPLPSYEDKLAFFEEFKKTVRHGELLYAKQSGDGKSAWFFQQMISSLKLVDTDVLLREIRKKEQYETVDPKNFTTKQTAFVRTLSFMANELWKSRYRSKLKGSAIDKINNVHLMLGVDRGRNRSVHAWAQGASVGISPHCADYLNGAHHNYLYLALLLCHELGHVVEFLNGVDYPDDEDEDEQAHSYGFYELFEMVMVSEKSCKQIFAIIENTMLQYLKERQKVGLVNNSTAKRMQSNFNNRLLSFMSQSSESEGEDSRESRGIPFP